MRKTRKIRRHTGTFISPIVKGPQKSVVSIISKKAFPLSETDRVTYCHEHTLVRKVLKVINVSYEIYIKKKWITIVRFDSDHGYLHRHTRISYKNKATIVDQNNLAVRGTAKHWLGWSIRHLTTQYVLYRRKFLQRSKLSDE